MSEPDPKPTVERFWALPLRISGRGGTLKSVEVVRAADHDAAMAQAHQRAEKAEAEAELAEVSAFIVAGAPVATMNALRARIAELEAELAGYRAAPGRAKNRLSGGQLRKAVQTFVQREREAGTVMSPSITPQAPGVELARARAILQKGGSRREATEG